MKPIPTTKENVKFFIFSSSVEKSGRPSSLGKRGLHTGLYLLVQYSINVNALGLWLYIINNFATCHRERERDKKDKYYKKGKDRENSASVSFVWSSFSLAKATSLATWAFSIRYST